MTTLLEHRFSFTAEDLVANQQGQLSVEQENEKALTSYAVFRKTSHKRAMTFVDYVGHVEASSVKAALQQAIHQFSDVDGLAWWLIDDVDFIKSDSSEESIESWFAPAKDKTYKQQSSYSTVGSKRRPENLKGKL